MRAFASRISAGTLLAAAVGTMLALPLLFPSGHESGVGTLPALQGLQDLRIDAPGWIFAEQAASRARAARSQGARSILLDPEDASGHDSGWRRGTRSLRSFEGMSPTATRGASPARAPVQQPDEPPPAQPQAPPFEPPAEPPPSAPPATVSDPVMASPEPTAVERPAARRVIVTPTADTTAKPPKGKPKSPDNPKSADSPKVTEPKGAEPKSAEPKSAKPHAPAPATPSTAPQAPASQPAPALPAPTTAAAKSEPSDEAKANDTAGAQDEDHGKPDDDKGKDKTENKPDEGAALHGKSK